jgi:hypothetical protein
MQSGGLDSTRTGSAACRRSARKCTVWRTARRLMIRWASVQQEWTFYARSAPTIDGPVRRLREQHRTLHDLECISGRQENGFVSQNQSFRNDASSHEDYRWNLGRHSGLAPQIYQGNFPTVRRANERRHERSRGREQSERPIPWGSCPPGRTGSRSSAPYLAIAPPFAAAAGSPMSPLSPATTSRLPTSPLW